MSRVYDRVALIGLGLIASSMAHAIRRWGLAGEIVGYAKSPETRAIAREIALCDRVTETAAEAVAGADLVVLCVPVGAMGAVAAEIGPHLAPGATVSDVGSVKRAVIDAVAPHLPEHVHFVPAHPIAGTEHSGPRSGFAELFRNRYTLIVPQPGTDPEALERLERYTEYVLGMYYTYDQRQYAEAEVFRLQVELAELHEELINTLVMAPDIGRPIYINT